VVEVLLILREATVLVLTLFLQVVVPQIDFLVALEPGLLLRQIADGIPVYLDKVMQVALDTMPPLKILMFGVVVVAVAQVQQAQV
jgi:hypothetical protein